MIILDLNPGSPEWHDFRFDRDNASEAPAMMGVSKYLERNELLRLKSTGDKQEFTQWFQENILDEGHSVEAKARPLAEEIIEDDLYAIVCADVDKNMGASLDGRTLTGDIIWECKQWNEEKAENVREGILPATDKWQVIQQLVVSKAYRCLYTVTDGTREKFVHMWVYLNDADEAELLAGWKQFNEDKKTFEYREVKPAPVGKSPDQLPALQVIVKGLVESSNLEEYKECAINAFRSIKTELKTDQDFADASKTIKFCKKVEDQLEAAKQSALSQTHSIDELFKAFDEIKAEARSKRLLLTNLEKTEKDARRSEIRKRGDTELAAHIEALNKRLNVVRLPYMEFGFAAVMKGKKTMASLNNAVDDEVARAKIALDKAVNEIEMNLKTLDELASDHKFLFHDLQSICEKPNEDFINLVNMRVTAHKQAEEERKAKEAEEAKLKEQEQQTPAKEPQPQGEPVPTREAVSEQSFNHQQEQKPSPTPHYEARRERPTDEDIISKLSDIYRVSRDTTIKWLSEMEIFKKNPNARTIHEVMKDIAKARGKAKLKEIQLEIESYFHGADRAKLLKCFNDRVLDLRQKKKEADQKKEESEKRKNGDPGSHSESLQEVLNIVDGAKNTDELQVSVDRVLELRQVKKLSDEELDFFELHHGSKHEELTNNVENN